MKRLLLLFILLLNICISWAQVMNPLIAINIKPDHKAITVNVGETEKLTKFLSEAYELVTPAAVAEIRWVSEDESIVKFNNYWDQQQNYIEEYQPLKAGETKMKAYQYLSSNDSFGLSSDESVTVTVLQPVTGLRISSNLNQHECNVGDDLTSYLNSLVKVLPDDASDKSFTWSVAPGTANEVVSISDQGVIKAVKAGMVTLVATSNNNPKYSGAVTVVVHNPADILLAQSNINVEYINKPVDISNLLKQNISFQTDENRGVEGLSITSNSAVVSISNVSYGNGALQLTASAQSVGQATITVGITYRDYLKDYTDPSAAGHTKNVSKTFTVTVTQGAIPVESLRINSGLNEHECNVGDDLTSYLNSLVTVLPDNADDKSFTWRVSSGDAVSISGGRISAVKAGRAELTATSTNNPQAYASLMVLVHNPATDIQFTKNTVNVDYDGTNSDISRLLQDNLTFLPAGYESIEGLTITSDRPNDVVAIDNVALDQSGTGVLLRARVLGAGQATITVNFHYRDYLKDYTNPGTTEHRITVQKTFSVVVTEVIPAVTSITYPDELTLSRYHDVALELNMEPKNARLDPTLLEIRFSESKNAGWGAAASVTPSPASALVWNVRGRFAGSYTYQIYYNGKLQSTKSGAREGIVRTPVEYPLAQGWDWISLYATDKSSTLPLKTTSGWAIPMQLDDENYVQEIRSQHELLYKDPELGFFGDIEQLSPSDGMYKINSHYDVTYADQMILNAGYDGLVRASEMRLPMARKGYTWVTYPHEFNHSIDVLGTYLKQSAIEGDMIIGRDMVVVFDGDKWLGDSSTVFEAGKGYIYYTESTTPKTINWGPATLAPEKTIANARRASKQASPWIYNPYAYPDCMAVIARLEDVSHPEDYSVGAFVGDDCRGQGTVNAEGLVCAAVSGQTGDPVTFRLYHKSTDSYQTLEGQFGFTSCLGSLSNPVMIHAGSTAIRLVGEDMLSLSISNDVIMVNGAVGPVTLTITDLQGRRVASCQGTTFSLISLPAGVYVVSAADAKGQVTKKIKK